MSARGGVVFSNRNLMHNNANKQGSPRRFRCLRSKRVHLPRKRGDNKSERDEKLFLDTKHSIVN